jgi:prepilin-type N-terminal cleavage/methylation domain-containing protein
MKRAFTLVELLVVIAIISLLLALGLPVMKQARERGAETVCQSNLRQMTMILKIYTSDHDGLFPNPSYLYHSRLSFVEDPWSLYHPENCRWHDAEAGLDSPAITRDHPGFKGDLAPYLGNIRVLRCKTGVRANLERGCNNSGTCEQQREPSGQTGPNVRTIPVVPQYTYTMNAYLHMTIITGGMKTQANGSGVDLKTIREIQVHKETQVTRSPSEVFAFGEENSWSVNTRGDQPFARSRWPASYDLSGYALSIGDAPIAFTGAIGLSSLDILPSCQLSSYEAVNHRITKATLIGTDPVHAGDAFATYHRPRRGDLNRGRSYVSLLDGHVQKVTITDQLRKSRQPDDLPGSQLGPGGNLRLAWPSEIPPLGGWENQ